MSNIRGGGSFLNIPIKRKVFISYHHANDQEYCDWLRMALSSYLDVFTDRSLDEPVRSNDAEYVNRRIREDYIKGSSLTIVLCGEKTHKRKYVDWEICSTLHHEHALLGIHLPTAPRTPDRKIIVPSRLYQNIQSGYATFQGWQSDQWTNDPRSFTRLLEAAIQASANKRRIINNEPKMQRNVS